MSLRVKFRLALNPYCRKFIVSAMGTHINNNNKETIATINNKTDLLELSDKENK